MTTALPIHAFPLKLIARLRCTADGTNLRLDPDCQLTGDCQSVVQGALRCIDCGKAFAIENGIVNMIDDALVDQESQHEQQVRNAQALEGNGPQAAASQADEHNAMEMIPTLEALPAGHGKTLLELGCGDGRYTVGLAREYEWIVAVDFSRESLRLLQRKLDDRRNVALVLGDVTTLKVSDSGFDCVFSTLVSNLPTRDHRNSLYRLAANSLRAGGRFVFSAHNHGLRQRLHGKAKSGRYRQGGIYRYNFSVDECRLELHPYFETVKAGPIQIYLPLARTLRLPLLPLSRFLETMPLINGLGELILCSAERSISVGAATLVDIARRAGKVRQDAVPPPAASRNTRVRLREALAPFRHDGTLPDYPLGSDFTEVEQRLVKALAWLKANTSDRMGTLRTVVRAIVGRGGADGPATDRMQLATPRGFGVRREARLLALALRETTT